MNAWLVLGRCGHDDIPLALLSTKKEAIEFASTATHDDVNEQSGRFGWNTRETFSISILEFVNGRPEGDHEIVRDFSCEPALV